MKRGYQQKFVRSIRSPLGSLPFRSKLSDQCRSICTARGGNFLKRHKGVKGYPFEIVLHVTNSRTAVDPFH